MKFNNKVYVLAAIVVLLASSCAKKLDLYPLNDPTSASVYSTADGYKAVLAKVYGSLSSTGNSGPAGTPDITGGLDEGKQVPFIRNFFNAEELPTDEAVCAWNDETIKDFHNFNWTSADFYLKGWYARPIYNVTLINTYLKEATPAKLAERNITGADAEDITNSVAEARFLRALNYWVMMDLFGKSTFVTEEDETGTAFKPREIKRADLFNYIESELKAIETLLPAPRTAVYGRVDRGAAWALLARIYLNAEVYTGTAKNTEAITYAKKVIDGGYSLHNSYEELFMADNDKATDEIIWAINCDGLRTTSYGNTTFFVHAAAGDDHAEFGVGGGWYGYRATSALINKFSDRTGSTDKRALFTTSTFGTDDNQIKIDDIGNFSNGVHVKYVNIRSDGGNTSDPSGAFSDVDFPMFRLAEMYLIYAEAVLRGGSGGDQSTAVNYINLLRKRAYGTTSMGQINPSDLTLQFVLDERARELYWEGHRRTDLVRYGLLTSGSYLWPWKGGVPLGTGVNSRYNLYAIPSVNITANPNLSQNTDY